MKKILLFLTIIAISQSIFAQKFNLSGKILDLQNNPIIGASIVIKGTFVGDVSKVDGSFKINNLAKGVYNVEFSFIGYKTIKKEINLIKDTEININLVSTSIVSDEIIISAAKTKTNTPVAQTTINKADLQKNNIVADIPYLLELTPSVVAFSETGTGVGYTNMRIRGTDMSRINVTINGIPLNDAESQGVYFVDIPDFTSSVNSIQIQRGVGTSKNGASAFGASINFQTLTLNPKPYTNINFAAGSFNTYKENISVGTGLLNNKLSFDVRYSKLNAGSYIQRGFSDDQSVYFSGTYYGKKDLLKAIVITGKERTGITWWGVPDYMIDSIRNYNPAGKYYNDDGNEMFYNGQTDNYLQNHYQLLYTHEINKNLNFNTAIHTTTGKGYYEQYIPSVDDDGNENLFTNYGLSPIYINDTILTNNQNKNVFPDSVIYATDMIRQKWLDNIFYGANANLNYTKNKLDISIGISANKYDGDHYGFIKWTKYNLDNVPQDYIWYKNKGIKIDKNAFAKMQYSLNQKLLIFTDFQIRNINYKLSGPDDDLKGLDQNHTWTFFNPKFGLNYEINSSNRAYISYAVANREPARADIKEATKQGGNIMPTFETLNDIEGGYQYKQKQYAFGINIYYMIYKNQLVNTGELNNVGNHIKTNVKDSYRRGIEIIFASKILKTLTWNFNTTLSQNRIKNYIEYSSAYDDNWNEILQAKNLGETHISYSPEIISSSSLSYSFIKYFEIELISKYVGKQYFDNTSSDMRKIDPYFVNNLKLSYTNNFKNNTEYSISFLVNNLLNEKYIANAYGGNWYEQGEEKSWAYYFPQAGTNYMIKLNLKF